MDTSEQAALRRAQDIHDLRILAWCVQRDRYRAEPRRVVGGRRGKARIMTLTYYVEAADYQEADRAVREITSEKGRPHTIRSSCVGEATKSESAAPASERRNVDDS